MALRSPPRSGRRKRRTPRRPFARTRSRPCNPSSWCLSFSQSLYWPWACWHTCQDASAAHTTCENGSDLNTTERKRRRAVGSGYPSSAARIPPVREEWLSRSSFRAFFPGRDARLKSMQARSQLLRTTAPTRTVAFDSKLLLRQILRTRPGLVVLRATSYSLIFFIA